MKYAFALTLIVIAAGIGGATVVDGDDWSPIVYPAQRLPLIFSHQLHLGTLALAALRGLDGGVLGAGRG